jgi:uncharacterized protein YkwD
VFRAINGVRRRHGLPRLRMVRRLVFVAKLHSYDMASHGRLSHSSTNGMSFDRRIRTVVNARTVGETVISFPGRASAGRIVRAWMGSPSHRRELLGWSYRRIGVGSAGSVVTADFASR